MVIWFSKNLQPICAASQGFCKLVLHHHPVFFLTACSKPAEVNKAIPIIFSRLWIKLYDNKIVLHSCCEGSDRTTIHRYYHNFHKNSGRVPHGGWSFIPGREKLSQQAHKMTVRQEVFHTPVLSGDCLLA